MEEREQFNTAVADEIQWPAELGDRRVLARWLSEHAGIDESLNLTARRLSGGTQNDVFQLNTGTTSVVLRRASDSGREDRMGGLLREIQLLRALADTEVPHARMLAADSDASLFGAPFYLTEFVDGWNPMDIGWAKPFDSDLGARRRLGFELIDGAAKLANVDWETRGLINFGHPEGFHDRQVDRWSAYFSGFQFREVPGLDVAANWLRRHRPRNYRPGIMHGDYQFANVIFSHGEPAQLAAIVDWEMATIGDPLLDVGWALLAWPTEGDDMDAYRYVDYEGMPPRDELLARYESISGREVDDIDYYVILARFKLAIVLEASVARRAVGAADARVDAFESIVLELARKAAELARSAG